MSIFSGLREEDSIPVSALKTRADLENCIQASPKELSAALDTLGAIVHNGNNLRMIIIIKYKHSLSLMRRSFVRICSAHVQGVSV